MSNAIVNVSKMFNRYAPNYVSASQAELGADAGPLTWRHAMEIAAERDEWLLSNVYDTCSTVRQWAGETGAWEQDEIDAWSTRECLALLVQNVASDIRNVFEQDCEVDTRAVVEQYESSEESESNFDWTSQESGDLHAEWFAF